MAVEDRVAEDRRLAQQLDRQAVPAAGGKGGEVRERLALFGQQAPEGLHVGLADGLVERQAETAGIDLAQVDPGGAGLGMDRRGTRAGGQAQGVEEMLLLDGHAQALQAGGEDRGQPVGAPGDAQQALRAVVTANMLAMLASSTWAVQMLLVAFSRRMCCSRVCMARR